MKIRLITLSIALMVSSVAFAQDGKKDPPAGETPRDEGKSQPTNKNDRSGSGARGNKGGPGKSTDGQTKSDRPSNERSSDKTQKDSAGAQDKGPSKNP